MLKKKKRPFQFRWAQSMLVHYQRNREESIDPGAGVRMREKKTRVTRKDGGLLRHRGLRGHRGNLLAANQGLSLCPQWRNDVTYIVLAAEIRLDQRQRSRSPGHGRSRIGRDPSKNKGLIRVDPRQRSGLCCFSDPRCISRGFAGGQEEGRVRDQTTGSRMV